MNSREDEKWHSLLRRSQPTFTGEEAPPYGFVTNTIARLSAEKTRQDLFERIGLRALAASLAMLALSAGIAFDMQRPASADLEPGLRGILQVENVPVS